MNQLQAFIERLKANKFLAGTGGLVILCGIIVTFPKSVSFLPEDLAKQVWNLAHDYIGMIIGAALLFVKGHGAVGDPAGKNEATVSSPTTATVKDVTITPTEPATPDDWKANARGNEPTK